MHFIKFLSYLAEKDIRLWVEDGNLRFSAAEGAFTDEIKQEVIRRKPELIEFFSQAKRANQQEIPVIPHDGNLLLSYAQQRFWFLNQLDPNNAAYNIPATLRIKGTLHIDVLNRSITEVIRRHEILRTVIIEEDGEPRQKILPAEQISIIPEDLICQHSENATDALIRTAAEEAFAPFCLATGPLLRTRIIRISESEHVFLATLHHIAADGWSLGILVSEIATHYKIYSLNQSSPLPDLSIQYADYAHWQRSTVNDDKLQQQLEYWERQLQAVPVLHLPTDKARPAVSNNSGNYYAFNIDKQLCFQLNQLSQQQGATLFMMLLAAFNVLLSRYSNQDDICLGTPIANRENTALEPLIGCFINTLAIRCDLSGEPSFLELLGRIKETTKAAFQHQDIPFEHVVDKLVTQRDLSTTPLFQSMFIMQNIPADRSITLPGLTFEPIEIGKRVAKFDLKLAVSEEGDQLNCEFEFRSELFETKTIKRFADHYIRLLTQIVDTPQKKLSAFELLEQEELTLLDRWNNTQQTASTSYRGIHQLFEQQAILTPDRIAFVCGSEQLSYGQLNLLANKQAHQLLASSIDLSKPVAIYLQRSTQLIIAMLATLKAGAAYIAIDHEYPADRIAQILDEGKPDLVITHTLMQTHLPEQQARFVVDSPGEDGGNNFFENPDIALQCSDLAYIIFTSGSTGVPKGVAIEHQQLSSYVEALQARLQLPDNASYAMVSTIAADLGNTMLYGALCNGGCLHLIDKDTALLGDALGSYFRHHQIDCLKIVPTHMRAVLDCSSPRDVIPERYLILGGETLHWDLVAQIQQFKPSCQLVNHYGPSESTIGVSCHLLSNGENQHSATVPVGHPFNNVTFYIVDKNLNRLPVGIPGELLIGGNQLARGYLNREDLTEAQFIANPFDEGRLYRTGDLARYLDNGEVEHLGRIDRQIKIRGYRIELGEIENKLQALPEVKTAVVTPYTAAGNLSLVAYVVANPRKSELNTSDNVSCDGQTLRATLQEQLPDYMVPNTIVMVDEIPITSNGKINFQALPKPDFNQHSDQAFIAPSNELEAQLAQIWSEILAVEKIGVKDDFFSLGGHSLLATRLLSRIQQQLAVALPLRSLFEHTTIATQAILISQLATAQLAAIPCIERSKTQALSHAQQRLLVLDRLQPGNPAYNIPLAMRIEGPLDILALEQAIIAIIGRHETLRTTFKHDKENACQCVNVAPQTAIEQLNLPENVTIEEHLKDFFLSPFDLMQGPLIKLQILNESSNQHILLISMHHIISDGWSIHIFMKEMLVLYQAFHSKQSCPLAELPIQYIDYAEWQRQELQKNQCQQQREYWGKQLKDAPVLELPSDNPRTPLMNADGCLFNFQIETKLADQLRELSRKQGATLFMTLMACFQVLLHRYSGQDDICVGTPTAGRQHPQLENLIGFFANTLVVRSHPSSDTSFSTYLQQIKQLCLSAYDNQDLPFEQVVDDLNIPRDLSYTPLFQVMLTLQNASESVRAHDKYVVDDLTFRSISGENDKRRHHAVSIKFDLNLGMTDSGKGKPIHASLEYRKQLFSAMSIERFVDYFGILLSSIVEQPDCVLGKLKLMDSAEQDAQLHNWNQTKLVQPTSTVQELIEAQVKRTPDAPAVCCGEQRLSYQALNSRANQLAHHLRAQNVKPGDRIGICLPPGIEIFIAVLASIKAGAAYVPMDVSYPTDRLQHMASNAELHSLISNSSQLEQLPQTLCPLLLLDRLDKELDNYSIENPQNHTNVDDLLYVVYTSGSTGIPKGAGVRHRNEVNLLCWYTREYAMDASDRALIISAFGFDLTQKNIFALLTVGGQVIFNASKNYDQQLILNIIEEEKITLINCAPSAIYPVIESENENDFYRLQSLRLVLLGGEPIRIKSLLPWLQSSQCNSQLINMYGPTECTDIAATYRVTEPGIFQEGDAVPIGSPNDNVQLYVLNDQLQPVPQGVVGELLIGGAGVGTGYLNNSSLNDEKFITNPFGEGTLYHTGDLARRRPDGLLEFVSRIDGQVKIRGFRIELGEIESAINTLDSIHACIVAAVKGPTDSDILAAYVVVEQSDSVDRNSLDRSAIRHSLRASLPEYMIPQIIVDIDGIPLTPNGKVDKSQLPTPGENDFSRAPYAAPSTETEILIAEIWQSTLQIDKVGLNDNFFELGGQSILAMQIVNAIRTDLQVELELGKLFEQPTIAAIAQMVEQVKIEKDLLLNDTIQDDHDDVEFVL